jgi:hypothetical protein
VGHTSSKEPDFSAGPLQRALLGVLIGTCSSLLFCVVASAQQQNPTSLPGQTTTAQPAANTPASTPVGTGSGDLQFLEVREFSNLTRVTGEARDRSFLTPGNDNGLDLNYLQDVTLGVRRLEAVSVLRYTDDPRVDPEHSSVQRAYLRITDPTSEYNFGDYLVSYSRLTYSQNLKGFHFIRTAPWGHGFRLLANVGTFSDRYGSLFKEGILGKPFTRVVSGLRAEQKLDRDKTIGFNWSYGNDIVRSIPIDPATGQEPFIPVDNKVASFDARMLFAKIWSLDGEIAYSFTNPDTRFNSVSRKDYGLRLDNTVRKGPWSLSVYWTRIMPSFLAINARQIADLQDVQARSSVDVSRQVQLMGIYRTTEDDLRHENLLPRTVFRMPEGQISFHNLPGLGSLVLDAGYRERSQRQLGLADRTTRAPYFDIAIPVSSSAITFGYERRDNIDRVTRTNQTTVNDFNISFRSIFNLGVRDSGCSEVLFV